MKRDAKRRKVALFGNFGTGNLGNEATLQAMIHNVRLHMPDSTIICICTEPAKAASDYNLPAFPIRAPFPIGKRFKRSNRSGAGENASSPQMKPARRYSDRWALNLVRRLAFPVLEIYRWLKAIDCLWNCDLLLMTGTGMLGDFAIKPMGLHYDIFRWAVTAKLCKCKLLFVSVGSGPLPHPLSKYFVKSALALADYRSYRDDVSRNHLEAIGANVKDDRVYPDLAFSFPKPAKSATSQRPGPVIGVGIMNYHVRSGLSEDREGIYSNYLESIASLVMELCKQNLTVRVLIGDVTFDQRVRQDLREVLARSHFSKDDNLIDEPAMSVDHLFSQLSEVDIVVASRFHNLIMALILSKPVIAISYHDKFAPLMRGFGLCDYCQDIERIEVGSLLQGVNRIWGRAEEIKLQIASITENYRTALDEQYERILGA